MDASQSALDSLRTVEFRETLKGYHRDDVDEYLEKAAVEAEGLQEQLRQGGERLRQAAERISQLEEMLEHQLPPPPPEAPVADDTLQRTLLLAQKFVDQTKADSEAEASRVIAEAESKARVVTQEAQSTADKLLTQSEQRLREEITRLEDRRTRLTTEVELMSRHLENERGRLRQALTEILKWVDANVHPEVGEASGTSRPADPTPPPAPSAPAASPPAPSAGPSSPGPSSPAPAFASTAPRPDPGMSTPTSSTPAAPPSGEGKDEGEADTPSADGAAGSDRSSGVLRSPGNSAVLPI
jgi:DivIVA domain-containing protein